MRELFLHEPGILAALLAYSSVPSLGATCKYALGLQGLQPLPVEGVKC
jgi:hypothetical protein